MTSERILVDCAKFTQTAKNIVGLQRTAVFSAAYDVTGSSKWRSEELAVADVAISDIGKVQRYSLSEADARGRKQLLRLLKRTEKDATRKEKYGKIIGEEAAGISVKETEGDIFSLMDYWYKRRHALFITTSVK